MANGTIKTVMSFEDDSPHLFVDPVPSGSIVDTINDVGAIDAPNSKEQYVYKMLKGGVADKNVVAFKVEFDDNSEWITIGFKMYWEDMTSGNADYRIADTGNGDWTLLRNSHTGLRLNDANGTIVGSTIDNVFTAATWHNIEIKYKKSNSTDVRVWVDRDLLLEASTVDMNGAAGDTFPRLHFDDFSAAVHEQHCGTSYANLDSGVIGDETQLGDWSSFKFDWQADISGNDTLLSGVWEDDINDSPRDDGTSVVYRLIQPGKGEEEGPKDGGIAKAGPEDDVRTEDGGELVGAIWMWRWKNDPDSGGSVAPKMQRLWGANATATTDGLSGEGGLEASTVIKTDIEIQGEGGSQFPALNEFMQIGFRAIWLPFSIRLTGVVTLYDTWCVGLYKEPVATGRIMSSIVGSGGLAGGGGIAGMGGGLAG